VIKILVRLKKMIESKLSEALISEPRRDKAS
jgi:hypothetical protein